MTIHVVCVGLYEHNLCNDLSLTKTSNTLKPLDVVVARKSSRTNNGSRRTGNLNGPLISHNN